MQNFSVLMSLYHKESSSNLEACLASIKGQTLLPTEIVMVLDGPIPEALMEVVEKWALCLPIHVFPLAKNVGLGKALNYGLTKCQYEWVLRMDTDDCCTPTRFFEQMQFVEQHPDIVLFGGQVAEFDTDIEHPTACRNVPTDYQELLKFAYARSPFNHMTVAYRKSTIVSLGSYQHHPHMEDYNLWIRVLAAGYLCANMPNFLVYARAGQNMLERRRGWSYIKSEWQLFKLKQSLHFGSSIRNCALFLMRSLPRLLPGFMLGAVYRLFLRSK